MNFDSKIKVRPYSLLLVTLLFLFPQVSQADRTDRIISLDLCTDWMLIKYAHRSQVLAYSPLLYRYPTGWIPQGLPIHDGSLEQILQLDPDLIISGEFNAIILRKRLQQLDINVEVMPLPADLQEINEYERRFHQLLQNDRRLKTSGNQFSIKNKKLLLLGANGMGTGRNTLENDVIEKAGWTNYINQNGFVSLDLEQIVNTPPDAVLWSSPLSPSLADLFAEHPVLHKLIGKQQWLTSDYWRWQCPGPWTFELINELALWKSS